LDDFDKGLNSKTSGLNGKIYARPPLNRTAAVSQTNWSRFECAAAAFQHSRGPVHREAEILSRSELNPIQRRSRRWRSSAKKRRRAA